MQCWKNKFFINFKIFFLVLSQENIGVYEKIILKQFLKYVITLPLLLFIFLLFLKVKKKEIYLIISKYILIFNICLLFWFIVTYISRIFWYKY